MTQLYVNPSATNVFIPNAKASGNLFVDFSRNINDFAVLKYCQPVPVEQTIGVWYQMGLDERARVLDADDAKRFWADGTPRPKSEDNADVFTQFTFNCKRRTETSTIGKMMSEQAAWNEVDRRSRMLAQKAMTIRTQAVVTAMTTSGNFPASHVSDLSGAAITGVTGNWAASTSARLAIRRTLNHIKNVITKDTRGAVNSDDLVLVMSPDTAEQVAVSQEIVELIKNSENGLKWLRAQDEFPKDTYGLPVRLYNTEVIIEKTVKVTSNRALTTGGTADYVIPLGTVIVATKPNALEGQEGGRSFSTASIHIYREDDMKVETDADSWNRLTQLGVTDNYDVNMTAPITGYLLENVC